MIEKLNEYYERGYLIKQTHPTLPLTIWNYSQTTQYERFWDEVTLMARGLVTDGEGNVVARPFDKFFNIEEEKHEFSTLFHVYEKMDGSLGILFNYKGEWVFASRGSFASDQALKFKEIFNKRYDINKLTEGNTYMFEIIYPENRIVVDYGETEDVVLLGKRCSTTFDEFNVEKYRTDFNVVKKYDGITDYKMLKGMVADDKEGFIVRFSNGSRCKVKGEEYIRLHKIMTEVSTTSVWNILANGGNMEEILVNVPDEFYDKIRDYEASLHAKFNEEFVKAYRDWRSIVHIEDRREFAAAAKNLDEPGWVFAFADGKDPSERIWKKIRPVYRPL